MPPPPRIRTLLKWAAPIIALILSGAWLAGTRWYLHWGSANGSAIDLYRGVAQLSIGPNVFNDPVTSGWATGDIASAPRSMTYRTGLPFHQTPTLPLWLPILIAAALTAFLWRQDLLARRRAKLSPLRSFEIIQTKP